MHRGLSPPHHLGTTVGLTAFLEAMAVVLKQDINESCALLVPQRRPFHAAFGARGAATLPTEAGAAGAS